MVSFEEVANGDYMKLLDLDNSADEECYRSNGNAYVPNSS
jgi:hypothetical protein